MSALPAATVEMINGLSDRNTRRLVSFIEELRKEETPPTPEEIEEKRRAFRELEAVGSVGFSKEYDCNDAQMAAFREKYVPSGDAGTSKKAFEHLMRYMGTLPPDFDYKAELAEARAEKYENIS